MIKPTVHLNGTSREMLQEGYRVAYSAVTKAIATIQQIEFNPRDYYVQGPEAWSQAVEEMTARIAALQKVRDELDEILESLEE